MKELLIVLVWLAVFVGGWRVLANMWIKNGKGHVTSHVAAAGSSFAVATIIFVLMVAGGSDKVAAVQPKPEKTGGAKETAVIAATQPSLGITPQQYKEQFNAASVATDDSPFEIGELNIQKGEIFDTAQVRLTANNALILAVTKQGLVNSVSTISTGDGTLNSGLNMLKISIVVVRSVNTKMSKEAAYKMGVDLFTRAGKSDGKSVSKVVGGVKYYAIFSDTLGYWFGAEIPQGAVDNK